VRCEDNFFGERADVSREIFAAARMKLDVAKVSVRVFETGYFRYDITRVIELCNDNDSYLFRLDLCTIRSMHVHRETLPTSQLLVSIHFNRL